MISSWPENFASQNSSTAHQSGGEAMPFWRYELAHCSDASSLESVGRLGRLGKSWTGWPGPDLHRDHSGENLWNSTEHLHKQLIPDNMVAMGSTCPTGARLLDAASPSSILAARNKGAVLSPHLPSAVALSGPHQSRLSSIPSLCASSLSCFCDLGTTRLNLHSAYRSSVLRPSLVRPTKRQSEFLENTETLRTAP